MLEREQEYLRMREARDAERAVAEANLVTVKALSPKGAYWRLSKDGEGAHARLPVDGREVLAVGGARQLPSTAPSGLPVRVVHRSMRRWTCGWMERDQVPNTKDAMRRAQAIIRRTREIEEAVHPSEVEEYLTELREARTFYGAKKSERYLAGEKGGQFKPRHAPAVRGVVRRALRKTLPELPRTPVQRRRAGAGRWVWLDGQRTFIPEHRAFKRTVDGRTFTSPPGSTELYADGVHVPDDSPLLRKGRKPQPLTLVPEQTAERPEWAEKLLVQRAHPPSRTGTNVPRQTLSDQPMTSKEDFEREAIALIYDLADEMGTEPQVTGIVFEPEKRGFVGAHYPTGEVMFGQGDPIFAVREAAKKRAAGEPLSGRERRNLYQAYKLIAHEALHAAVPIPLGMYARPEQRALEEATVEELSHHVTVRRLRETGQTDVLEWLASAPEDIAVEGTYTGFREGLDKVLNEIGVAPEARHGYLMELMAMREFEFHVGPVVGERITKMADDLHARGEAIGTELAAQGRIANLLRRSDEWEAQGPFTNITFPDVSDMPRMQIEHEGKPIGNLAKVKAVRVNEFGLLEERDATVLGIQHTFGAAHPWMASVEFDDGLVRHHVLPPEILDVLEPGMVGREEKAELSNGEVTIGDQVRWDGRADGGLSDGEVERIFQVWDENTGLPHNVLHVRASDNSLNPGGLAVLTTARAGGILEKASGVPEAPATPVKRQPLKWKREQDAIGRTSYHAGPYKIEQWDANKWNVQRDGKPIGASATKLAGAKALVEVIENPGLWSMDVDRLGLKMRGRITDSEFWGGSPHRLPQDLWEQRTQRLRELQEALPYHPTSPNYNGISEIIRIAQQKRWQLEREEKAKGSRFARQVDPERGQQLSRVRQERVDEAIAARQQPGQGPRHTRTTTPVEGQEFGHRDALLIQAEEALLRDPVVKEIADRLRCCRRAEGRDALLRCTTLDTRRMRGSPTPATARSRSGCVTCRCRSSLRRAGSATPITVRWSSTPSAATPTSQAGPSTRRRTFHIDADPEADPDAFPLYGYVSRDDEGLAGRGRARSGT